MSRWQVVNEVGECKYECLSSAVLQLFKGGFTGEGPVGPPSTFVPIVKYDVMKFASLLSSPRGVEL